MVLWVYILIPCVSYSWVTSCHCKCQMNFPDELCATNSLILLFISIVVLVDAVTFSALICVFSKPIRINIIVQLWRYVAVCIVWIIPTFSLLTAWRVTDCDWVITHTVTMTSFSLLSRSQTMEDLWTITHTSHAAETWWSVGKTLASFVLYQYSGLVTEDSHSQMISHSVLIMLLNSKTMYSSSDLFFFFLLYRKCWKGPKMTWSHFLSFFFVFVL